MHCKNWGPRLTQLMILPLVSLCGCSSSQAPEPAIPAWTPASAPATVPQWKTSTATTPRERNPSVPSAQAVVSALDRSEEDRHLDAGRHPVELLEFLELRPGMRVLELGSGTGYTTELLARAVAPNGVVYGQNAKFMLDRFAEGPWSHRLTKPIMKSVVRLDRDFDDPVPNTVKDLDAAISILVYHDTVWLKYDRQRMNRAVYDALRTGGIYVVIDHSARPASGLDDVQTLHRIDERAVREEVLAAGFRLSKEADFLRNPADSRDWNASPKEAAERRGSSDRFALKFVKP